MPKDHILLKPWIRTILILPAFLIVAGMFQILGDLVLGISPSSVDYEKSLFEETMGALFMLMGTFLVVGVFRKYIDRESFQSMGFDPEGFRIESMAGLALGAVMMGGGFAGLLLLGEIQWTGTNPDRISILQSIILFAMVAFTEELFLRGYVLNNLMKSMHRYVALIVSSLMFTLIHIFNPNFTWIGFSNILLAGVLLGLPYIYNQRLWLPIALHFSWNFFQGSIFGFNVSGQETYSLITQSRTTDTLWNGGAFGFEGSVLSLIFELLAICMVGWYYNRKEKTSAQEITPPQMEEANLQIDPAD